MGDNTTTTSTTPIVQSSTPYAGSIPHIEGIMNIGSGLYNANYGTGLWGGTAGQTANAPLDPYLSSGLSGLTGISMSPEWASIMSSPLLTGSGLVQTGGASQFQPATNAYNQALNTAGLPNAAELYLSQMASGSQPTNPFLDQMLEANAARIGNRTASLMSGAGRYGSAGMMDAVNRSIAETNNPLMYQAAEAARNRQLQAAQLIDQSQDARAAQQMQAALGLGNIAQNILANQRQWAGMTPELWQSAMSPYNQLVNVGNFNQTRAQQEQALQRSYFEQLQIMPWTQLARYQGAITSLAGILPRTTTQSGTTSTQSTPTPWTTYAGLGLAGLGALSDERMKTDITPLGIDVGTGLMLYAFRYKGDPKHYPKVVGPMAQEVREKYPHLVREVAGYLCLVGEDHGHS